MIKKGKIKNVAGVYGVYFLAGMMVTIFGPVNAIISNSYEVSLASLGLFITFMSIGRVMTSFFVGVFFPKISNRKLLISGIVFVMFGALFISIFKYSNAMYVFSLMMGLGHGLFDISGNSMISDIFPDKRGNALNFLHLFFSFGSFSGPAIFALVINGFGNWYFAFIAIFILSFVLFLYNLLFVNVSGKKVNKKNIKFKIEGILVVVGLIMFFYVGVGQGLNTWVNTYLDKTLKMNILNSSIVLSMYNLGVMTGRIIASYISEKVGYSRMLLINAFGALLFISLAIVVSDIFIIAMFLFLAGISLGPVFPTSIALATWKFKDHKQEVAGLLSAIASGGSMLIPLIFGKISDVYDNVIYGMYLFIAMLMLMLILSIGVYFRLSERR